MKLAEKLYWGIVIVLLSAFPLSLLFAFTPWMLGCQNGLEVDCTTIRDTAEIFEYMLGLLSMITSIPGIIMLIVGLFLFRKKS